MFGRSKKVEGKGVNINPGIGVEIGPRLELLPGGKKKRKKKKKTERGGKAGLGGEFWRRDYTKIDSKGFPGEVKT